MSSVNVDEWVPLLMSLLYFVNKFFDWYLEEPVNLFVSLFPQCFPRLYLMKH